MILKSASQCIILIQTNAVVEFDWRACRVEW